MRVRANEHPLKYNFASNWSRSLILRALENLEEPFMTPQTDSLGTPLRPEVQTLTLFDRKGRNPFTYLQ